jgi:hypothetical protein
MIQERLISNLRYYILQQAKDLPGQSSSVLHWGVAVGFPVPVVVVLVPIVVVLVGGIPQIVSLGSLTH